MPDFWLPGLPGGSFLMSALPRAIRSQFKERRTSQAARGHYGPPIGHRHRFHQPAGPDYETMLIVVAGACVRDPGADRDLAHRVLSEPRLEDAAEARLVHFLGGDLDLFGCGADGVRAKFCGREILELPAGLCRPASSRRHVRDARREADDPCIVTGGLVDGTGGVGEPRRWAGARSGLHRSALHVVGACTISRRTACRRERGGLKA